MPREMVESNSIWVEGIGFDGSSIRGFQQIQESDMILIPDAETAQIDPFRTVPTLNLICDVKDPITQQPYSRDPRYIARKAEDYLRSTGIADTCYVGPEPEFFVFDDIRFDQGTQFGYYYVDSVEGSWNSGKDEGPNLGYKPRLKEGYFPVPPHDSLQDIRSEMVLAMEKVGIKIEVHHHEVATAGQCEIDMRFDTLLKKADDLLWYKYIVKNVAKKHGKVATFMPKPLFGDNGSGMHTHQSLWKDGKPLFGGDGYALTSEPLPLVHRRPSEARPLADGLLRADDELLQAAGARLRGAGQPGLLRAQPLGRGAHPGVQREPEGEAHRVPPAGPDVQPVPRLLRDADGRPGRHPEEDGPGQPVGEEHLRAVGGGSRQDPDRARLA